MINLQHCKWQPHVALQLHGFCFGCLCNPYFCFTSSQRYGRAIKQPRCCIVNLRVMQGKDDERPLLK